MYAILSRPGSGCPCTPGAGQQPGGARNKGSSPAGGGGGADEDEEEDENEEKERA